MSPGTSPRSQADPEPGLDADRPGVAEADRGGELETDGSAPNPTRHLSRRRLVAAGGVVVMASIVGGVAVLRGGGRDRATADGNSATAAALATAMVERRDLEERAELEGTLGHGDVAQVSLTAEGTITGLPPIGTVVDRGQTLVEVNGRPVPLLFGPRPLWRELGPDVDDGTDVEQLEANLVALGIATASELPVDQDWTGATTAAVEEWQRSLGLDDTGTVSPGQVAFLPGAVRVAEHPTPAGGSATGPVVGVTGPARVVTVDLEATRQSLVEEGQAVDVVLPDGTETTGTVSSVGNVATSPASSDDQGGDPNAGGDSDDEATIEVTIALDDPAAGGDLDQAPVTVRVVTRAAEGVLAVPVEALLVLAGGDYAVERVGAGGTTSPVTVELGSFADGWVEVTGDLAEGDEVVVPE